MSLAISTVWMSFLSAWIRDLCFLPQVYSNYTMCSFNIARLFDVNFETLAFLGKRKMGVVGTFWHIMAHFVILVNSELGFGNADAWKQVEYSVKARLVSVSVEVAYTDSMKGTDTTSKDTVDEQLHLHLAGNILSFAVSLLPVLFGYQILLSFFFG